MQDKEYTFLTPCFIPHLIKNLCKFNSFGNYDDSIYTAFLNAFLDSSSYAEFNTCCQMLASGGGLYSRSMVDKRQAIIDDALSSYILNAQKTA